MAQPYELQQPPFPEGQQGRSNKGYTQLPTEQPPPYDGGRPPSTGYRHSGPAHPAPYPAHGPVVQQQQSSNIVVVGNQPNPVQPVSVVRFASADDYLITTVCLFLLCLFLGNFPVMLCLFPALIFSCMASTYKDAGENELASHFGSLACKCNVGALIPALMFILSGVVVGVVVVLFIVGVISL